MADQIFSIEDLVRRLIQQAANTRHGSRTGKDPNVIDPYAQHPMNYTYNQMLRSNAGDDQFLSLLSTLGIKQEEGLTGSQRDDWNKQLLDQQLNYLLTQENRKYNVGLRDEQRVYDSPLSQLARLMGAGISRDAAIQMLNGSGSGGSAAAPYSDPASAANGIAASESALNGVNKQLGIAQAVFGGINTIAGLVSLGFSVPQAIQQTKSLSMQNTMSQKALVGLNAADAVLGSLESAVSTGVLSTKDVDGFSNATDALNYINDHRDTDAFKPLFQDGSFAQVYGTKLGRDMFSQAWNSVRQSKDAGTLLDYEIRRQDLQNSLSEIQTNTARRDYFFGFQQAVNSLIKDNEEIGILWNQLKSGEMQVLIDGERYEQSKVATNISRLSQTHAERESYKEGVQFKAFEDFVRFGEPEEPNGASNGQDIINYLTFGDWYNKLQHMLVTTSSNHPRDTYDHDTNKFVSHPSPREEYKSFLKNHQDLLYTGALIQAAIQSGRLNSWTGDNKSVWQFFDMWKSSGASDFVTSSTKVASDVATPLLLVP